MLSFTPNQLIRRFYFAIGLMISLAGLTFSAAAQSPILVVHDADGKAHSFTSEAIAALPWAEIHTHTRWAEGNHVFRGPLLTEILKASGITREDLAGKVFVMMALNDFRIEVPISDAWDYGPILAREMNGQIMSVRQKGPLWFVYPRDTFPELQASAYDDRWIWQLSEIFIK